jgi:hypothetical protein
MQANNFLPPHAQEAGQQDRYEKMTMSFSGCWLQMVVLVAMRR